MSMTSFLTHKILHQIELSGKVYKFDIAGEDDYHQPAYSESVEIKGLYHEKNTFITLQTGDSGSVQRKKNPMILVVLTDDVKRLTQGSKVSINGNDYKVTGVLDVQNYGIAADISLEMVV